MARRKPRRRPESRHAVAKQGLPPGTAAYLGEPRSVEVGIQLVRYGPDVATVAPVGDVAEILPIPADRVSWINVDGVHDVATVTSLAAALKIHPLAVEDALNPSTLPKAEAFGDQVFLALKMVARAPAGELAVELEQVSVVIGPSWVLSLQERPGDAFDAVRQRIRSGTGRIRRKGADYLAHALMDAVVDGYFVVLEAFEEAVLSLEERVLQSSLDDASREVHRLKMELIGVRRAIRPMQGLLTELLRADATRFEPDNWPYLRDLQDHVRQATEILDVVRDRLSSVLELHLAMTSHRMNQVMQVLTLVATIFIPLTFIAGIYGMNFAHMPELHWRYGYPLALAVMLGIGVGMGLWFRHRRWL